MTKDIRSLFCSNPFNRSCSHPSRHRWIGFHNNVSSCGCTGDCTDCRADWTWTDGSSTDYTNWDPSQPNSDEIYALLARDGTWHGFASRRLKFICKTRELRYTFSITLLVLSYTRRQYEWQPPTHFVP